MKSIAVIPARGGSKRIPNKNIIDFMGKPMIVWTIEAATKSNLFDKIIVSTDSHEIAELCESYGISVPFLREDFSDDISPVSVATISAIEQAENYYKEKYDIVVQLMANTPLRMDEDIIKHFNNFLNLKNTFQVSSFKFEWMNPWWAFKLNVDGSPDWMLKEGVNKRSQDLEQLYCPTGAIWVAKVDQLKLHKTFYGPDVKFCEMNWTNAVDIDNYFDLDFAKVLYTLNKKELI